MSVRARLGRVGLNAGVSLLVVGMILGAGELLARIRYNPGAIAARRLFEYDSEKVYRLRPGYEGSFAGVPVRTNSRGYRDREFSATPAPGVHRILAIGDSVTFGHGVPAEETFPKKLEARLAALEPGERFEVVNTAAPGNAPFQEYVDLERGLDLEPGAVIVQFTLNDVIEPYRKYRRFGGSGYDYHMVSDVGAAHEFMTSHSALYLLLSDIIRVARLGAVSASAQRRAAQREELYSVESLVKRKDDPAIRRAWDLTLADSARMVERCRSARIACIWIVTPFRFQHTLAASGDEPQAVMRRFAEEHRLPFVDVLPELRARAERAWRSTGTHPSVAAGEASYQQVWSTYFMDDDHLTPLGHELVADLLAPVVIASLEPAGVSPAWTRR